MPPAFIVRPLSPVNSEPLIPLTEDIVCLGSDDEKSVEEHRDKRRRIEFQAQQYLQGRPLFILSAGLRGPLNDTWVNPWAKKKRRNGDDKRRSRATSKEIINSHSWKRNAEAVLEKQSDNYNAVTPPRQDPQALALKPSDFQNWSKRDLAQATETSLKSPRKRFKAENVYFGEHPRRTSRSPTPTPPNSKPRDQALGISTYSFRRPAKLQPNPQTTRDSPGDPSNPGYEFGFPSINKRASPQDTGIQAEHGRRMAKLPAANVENREFSYPRRINIREVNLNKADGPTRMGRHSVQQLSQAVEQAVTNDGYVQARNVSERAAPRAFEGDISLRISNGSEPAVQGAVARAAQADEWRAFEDSPHALPPSTNLPEFPYRYARKQNPLSLKDRPSFAETLGIAKAKAELVEVAHAKAKAKAQEQEIRRLSFTASGNVKNFESNSRRQSPHRTSSPLQQRRTSSLPKQTHESNFSTVANGSSLPKQTHQSNSSTVGNGSMATTFLPSISGSLSDENNDAQIVSPVPVLSGLVPFGPSTNLLETDKLSLNQSVQEGDSYADLSTQAAIFKAQRKFQKGVFSPVVSSQPQHNEATTSVVTPRAHEAAKASRTSHQPLREPSPTRFNPAAVEDEPMSTQAMVDALSPFVMTTMKKDTNAVLSPNSPISPTIAPARLQPYASASAHAPPPSIYATSNKHSQPSSSLSSFSAGPNSTLNESYQQEGQQEPPQPRYFDSNEWDLDAAIDEAGQFLGSWDVDIEARKEGLRESTGAGTDDGKARRGDPVEKRHETRVGLVEG
ncbi:hypothetical protein MMC07_008270 [Pseudocyphellaria aurata]|nr:hypothetical protein [Pseudocyphellaria aurata]